MILAGGRGRKREGRKSLMSVLLGVLVSGGTLVIIIPFRRGRMRRDQALIRRVASEFQAATLRRVPYGPDQRESIRPIP